MTDVAADNLTDIRQRANDPARLARRYAAERRFRYYGIAAIVATACFLAFLFGDILSRGLPAFFEHRLNLTLTADAAIIDPANTREPQTIRAADYDGLIRDALRKLVPEAESRADRKLLAGLLSTGAADDFREMMLDNPSLIGGEITVPVLLSDDADQFLKGYQTERLRQAGTQPLAFSAEGEAIRITSAAGEFGAAFAKVMGWIAARLARDKIELDRLSAAVADLERGLKNLDQRAAQPEAPPETSAARDKAAADLAGLVSNRDVIKARVEALEVRLAQADGTEQLDSSLPSFIVEANGGVLKLIEISPASALAMPLAVPTTLAGAGAGQWSLFELSTPEDSRRTGDKEAVWLDRLSRADAIERGFAWRFLTSGDSREPELAGIRGALMGSALTLLVTLLLCLPIGVGAAIYLEEFAPKNRLTELIEVNINNLAAVPSIVFGLLGLAMFLNFFGLPRSAPLVGGLVLALLVLPTIIIAARAALKAVPPSIKEAALGVGASQQQAIFHHVLPLAMPGIMTGTIIGMAHALGETAPLLMIGMVAFIVDVPGGITDAATALPVQIYLWSDLPEIAFQAKTAGAIIVLLVFLFVMNAAAIVLRKRFERRW